MPISWGSEMPEVERKRSVRAAALTE